MTSNALIQLIIFGLQEAISLFPQLATDLQAILANGNPTVADFATLRAKVASESYLSFVPGSALAAVQQNNVLAASSAAPAPETSSAAPAPKIIATPLYALPAE